MAHSPLFRPSRAVDRDHAAPSLGWLVLVAMLSVGVNAVLLHPDAGEDAARSNDVASSPALATTADAR